MAGPPAESAQPHPSATFHPYYPLADTRHSYHANFDEPFYQTDREIFLDEHEVPQTTLVNVGETPSSKRHHLEHQDTDQTNQISTTTFNLIQRPASADNSMQAAFSFMPISQKLRGKPRHTRKPPVEQPAKHEKRFSHSQDISNVPQSKCQPEAYENSASSDGNDHIREEILQENEPAEASENPATRDTIHIPSPSSMKGQSQPSEQYPQVRIEEVHSRNMNHLRDRKLDVQPCSDDNLKMPRPSNDHTLYNFVPAGEHHSDQEGIVHSNTPPANVVDMTMPTPTTHAKDSETTTTMGNRTRSAGGPPIHDSRVSKVARRGLARSSPRLPNDPSREFINSKQPSEEDLLYLLMSRARQRSSEIKKLEYLEEQNAELRHQKEISDAELQQAIITQADCANQKEMLNQNLHKFKEKYYKLKKWALEANSDCELLERKAYSFQTSITDLTNDRNELVSLLRDAQASVEKTSNQIHNIRQGVGAVKTEVKTQAEGIVSTISHLQDLLHIQSEHLRDEKHNCKKLELHIVHMQHERNRRDSKFHAEQRLLNETLKELSENFATLQAGNMEKDSEKFRMLECLAQCQSLLGKDLATKSDVDALKEDLASTTSSINILKSSVPETVQTAIGSLKDDLQHDTSAQAIKLLSAVQSDKSELIKAKEELARLEQKAEQTKAVMDLIQGAKETAQDRENELRRMNENLINALGDNKSNAQKQTTNLENTISSLLTKWQSACAQLAECAKQKAESQDEIIDLSIQLAEAEQEHACLQAGIKKADEHLGDLKREIEHQNKDELNYLDQQLRNLQHDLDHEIQKRQEGEEEVDRLRTLQAQTQRDVERSRQESSVAAREIQELRGQLTVLEHSLSEAEEKASKLDEAVKFLEDLSTELDDTKRGLASFEHLQEGSLAQGRKLAEKIQELESLREQFELLRDRSTDLEKQVREKDKLADENSDLRTTIGELHQDLAEKVELENKLKQTTMKVAELEASLATALTEAAKADALNPKNTSLKEAVTSPAANFESVGEQCEQIVPLKETIKEKTDQILALEGQLAASNAQFEELRKLKEDLQHQMERNSTLQQQILSPEGAVSNLSLDKEATQAQPQRRAADRSGSGGGTSNKHRHPVRPMSVQDADIFGDECSTPLGVSTMVPETQLEEVIEESQDRRTNSSSRPAQQKDDSSSELSEHSSPCENTDIEDDELENVAPKGQHRFYSGSQRRSKLQEDSLQTQDSQQTVERPPSSSCESLSDQMLLDQVNQGGTQIETAACLGASHSAFEGLIGEDDTCAGSSAEFVMPWNRINSRLGPSPRRLRSGSRTRGRQSTPFPEPTAQPRINRESTPAITRERYQPNSAAKRRVEQEDDEETSQETFKRLKRTPANMEVKSPRQSPSRQQAQGKIPQRVTLSFRKSSSVVGTNAPAPGKSQRSSRPTRKGSRKDKYSSRFAAERE